MDPVSALRELSRYSNPRETERAPRLNKRPGERKRVLYIQISGMPIKDPAVHPRLTDPTVSSSSRQAWIGRMESRHHSRANDHSRGRVRPASYKGITPLKHPLTSWCLEHLSQDSIQKPSGKEGTSALTRFITSMCEDQIVSETSKARLSYRYDLMILYKDLVMEVSSLRYGTVKQALTTGEQLHQSRDREPK